MLPQKRALAAVLLLSGAALAGGGGNTPARFSGTASPVVPPTACRDVLPSPRRRAHGYAYGKLSTVFPRHLASCWRGTLRGHPFTLTGYGSAGAESAVVVDYRGKRTLLNLGMGSPNVTAFSGSVVCYIPTLAKGVIAAVDIERGQPFTGDTFTLCHAEETVNNAGQAVVGGLNHTYRVGEGVLRLF